jgi:hypothetical protein
VGCNTTSHTSQSQVASSATGKPADTTLAMPPGSSPNDEISAKAGLKLVSFASDGIETVLKPANGANGLPEALQGLWWLDGNPQKGSVVLTLQHASYDPATRTVTFPFNAPYTYSFIADADGQKDFDAGLKVNLVYKITFSEDYRHLQLQSQITIGGHTLTLPTEISNFTATLQEDGHWLRQSRVFGFPVPDYHMRRIVNASGQREPAYQNYLASIGANSYVATPR